MKFYMYVVLVLMFKIWLCIVRNLIRKQIQVKKVVFVIFVLKCQKVIFGYGEFG